MYQLVEKTKKDREEEFKWFLYDHKNEQPIEILTGIPERDQLQENWPEAKIVHDPRPPMQTMIWLGYLE